MSGIALAQKAFGANTAAQIIFTGGSGYLPLSFDFTLLSNPFYTAHLLDALRKVPVYRRNDALAPSSPLPADLPITHAGEKKQRQTSG